MTNKIIPFPSEKSSPEPDPIVVRHRRVIVTVGSLRYAIDMTAEARLLRAEPAACKVAAVEAARPAVDLSGDA